MSCPPENQRFSKVTNLINTMSCPFCSILKNDVKNQIIERGTKVTAIKKLSKKNSVNFLIITNEHTINLKTLKDDQVMNEIVEMANKLSGYTEDGSGDYTLLINNGKKSIPGQAVFHMHAHIRSQDKEWGPDLDFY